MQGCISDAGPSTGGVDIALPVSAFYHSAFAIHPASGIEGIGPRRIDFRQKQGSQPTSHSVA